MDHLEKNGFISLVTSPHVKGLRNVVLHDHDYTPYKKLAIWFGNEEGASVRRLSKGVIFALTSPCTELLKA